MKDDDPIICPVCGGTGLHPYKNGGCTFCHGSGEIADDIYDKRYKMTVNRAHRDCIDSIELFV